MSDLRLRITAAIVYLGAIGSIAHAQPVTPTFNDVSLGIVALDDGTTYELHTDIYLSSVATGPRPIVIWIHGGGWSSGSYQTLPLRARRLLDRGIHVAAADYRLSWQAIFPAQIHDVKGLVRHLRANTATYQIDPDRIGAWGSSAGGHLTALLANSGGVVELEGASGGNAVFSSRIQVGVDYFGPTNLFTMDADATDPPGSSINHDAPNSPESRLVGFNGQGEGIGNLHDNIDNPSPPYPEKVNLVLLANTDSHATADDPPLLIAHGLNDTSVPFNQSVRLFDALDPAGVDVRLLPIPGAGHGDLGNATDEIAREYLVRRLIPRMPADMNCDGQVDGADLQVFVLVLTQPDGYTTAFPTCNVTNGDFTGDFEVDGADIAGFIQHFLAP